MKKEISLSLITTILLISHFVLVSSNLKLAKISNSVEKIENTIETQKEVVTLKINDPIIHHLYNKCVEYDLDLYYMLSLIQVESQFKKNAISYLGIDYGYGLMQVSKVCLQDYNNWNGTNYTQKDLSNPYINITIGTWVYNQNKRYLKEYDLDKLLSAYNIGARSTKTNGLNYSYVNKVHNVRKIIDVENIKIK